MNSSFPSPLTRILRWSHLVPALIIAARAAGADPGPVPPEVVNLDPVVVMARPSEQPLLVRTDPKAAAQPIPAQDGAEALRGIGGFNIIRKGGTDGDPVFRGMAGSRLGVLLDGENLLGGCSNRMDPPTAYVFPAAYDVVTVLKGPQSVLHGPGNSAGVVLFERTPVRLTAPILQAEGALTVGSAGRNDQWLQVRGGRPAGYAEAGVTRTAAGDYADGDGRRVASAYERWSARLALGWTPNSATWVEATGMVSDGEAAYADRAMDGAAFTRRNAGLRFRHHLGAGWLQALEGNAYFNEIDHVMDNYSLRTFVPTAMMPGRSASNPDRRTHGARLAAELAVGEHVELTVGTELQANRHRARSTSNETLRPYESQPWVRDADFAVAGLMAESRVHLSDRSRIVAGVRADSWQAEDHRRTVAAGMTTVANPTADGRRATVLPQAFVRFEREARSGLTVFAGAGHVQRFPDYWELIGRESTGSLSAFATRAERTTQADLGLHYRRGTVVIAASLFANRIDDFILIESGVAKPGAMGAVRLATIVRNVDAASLGGEASLAWSPRPGWSVDASVAAVRGQNRTDARPLAQQPPLEGRLGFSYATPRWSVGTLLRGVASQDRFAARQGSIVGQDLGRSPGFAVWSLNAAWKPAAWLQVSVGIDNVLDRTYAEHLSRGGAMVAGFPPPSTRVNEPGRTGWLKADFRY
ncbi:MAG TPA: TonB-dependent copper receptor [Opitutaceae bacterium]